MLHKLNIYSNIFFNYAPYNLNTHNNGYDAYKIKEMTNKYVY